jgi:hypothetical protein
MRKHSTVCQDSFRFGEKGSWRRGRRPDEQALVSMAAARLHPGNPVPVSHGTGPSAHGFNRHGPTASGARAWFGSDKASAGTFTPNQSFFFWRNTIRTLAGGVW